MPCHTTDKLVKADEIFIACKKYLEASKADPADPIPPRNLSAAYYEIALYKRCITTAKKALSLLSSPLTPPDQAPAEKLNARIAKAESHAFTTSAQEKKGAIIKILAEVPRYKPSMFVTSEYFTVGHDTVTSVFEPHMFAAFAPDATEIAFFLGGVGDARIVLQTMTVILESERLKGSPERKYHFTVNDISKYALARDIVVWMLLERVEKTTHANEEEMLLNTVFFVYLSTMMPSFAFEVLEETIAKAIVALENGKSPLEWLFLQENDIPFYLAALRHWLGEGRDIFSSSEIIEKVSMKMRGTNMQNVGTTYHREKTLYLKAAVLFPSERVLESRDPDFLALMKKYSGKPSDPHTLSAFKKHLERHWHFNTTLMDKEWCADLMRKELFDLGFDPFESIENHFPYDEVSSKPVRPDRLVEHMKPFFLNAAKAIGSLSERFRVEAILGDYVEVAEKIQHGLYDAQTRPKEFPVLYERVHLSNVP